MDKTVGLGLSNKTYFFKCIALFGLLTLFACSSRRPTTSKITTSNFLGLDSLKFDTIIDGKKVGLYKIENKSHLTSYFTNYGGRIVSLIVPDKTGDNIDVVSGFSSIKGYTDASAPYYGATIGRFANRIEKGAFAIDGQTYQTSINNGGNTLHGGTKGFNNVVWDAVKLNDSTIQFSYLSKDGEMGFPGNLNVTVTYQLTAKNELKIAYNAQTDKKTVVNLTNHAFFNLNGEGSGTILNHQLQIFAKVYTPLDANSIPTGKFEQVKNSPFDFLKLTTIGKRINDPNPQLKIGQGYDQNFVLLGTKKIKHAASVIGDKSGIVMDVYTDQPGLQFFSGNFMKSVNTFKSGVKDDFRTAFCLETQHFPNSPNQANFPSTILKPSEVYKSISIYQFSLDQRI